VCFLCLLDARNASHVCCLVCASRQPRACNIHVYIYICVYTYTYFDLYICVFSILARCTQRVARLLPCLRIQTATCLHYACIHMYMYTYIFIHTCLHSMRMCIYMHSYMCMFSMFAALSAHPDSHVPALYMCMYIYIYVSRYTCISICTCLHSIRMCIYMHLYVCFLCLLGTPTRCMFAVLSAHPRSHVPALYMYAYICVCVCVYVCVYVSCIDIYA